MYSKRYLQMCCVVQLKQVGTVKAADVVGETDFALLSLCAL